MEGQGCCYEADIENLRATELRLGLPGGHEAAKAAPVAVARGSKRAMPAESEDCRGKRNSPEAGSEECHQDTAPPAAKAQVVGWPPVRSYRKNSFKMMKETVDAAGLYVKVSMDGAPYLRKIDLKVYAGYEMLRVALEDMFKCFSLGEISSAMEQHDVAEHAIAYEDKDGDLMLVGDVPWEMFITSCKRLRIMKGSEAKGLC